MWERGLRGPVCASARERSVGSAPIAAQVRRPGVPVPFVAEDLLDQARRLLPGVVELRRRIHLAPELGLELPRTQEAVIEALGGLDLEIRTGESLTSVVADLRGGAGEGPTILLRADMDALPMPEDTGLDFASETEGAMHACGHDAHTAMLVGAARLLAAGREQLTGTVRFMFQPGEEGQFGARAMIGEGVLESPSVDAAFGLHVTPNIPMGIVTTRGGPVMASADMVHITVTGRGGHASTPHLALDPMPVAAAIVQALQVFATRAIDAFDPVVITITPINAGTAPNIIPESGEMSGPLRAVSERSRNRAIEGIERVVAGIAAAHGAQAVATVDKGYQPTVNDPAFAAFVGRAARRLFGDSGFFESPAPIMGAEDFGYVLSERPGAFAFLGACPPGENASEAASCHSNRMRIDEDAMSSGVALYSAVALAYLAADLDAPAPAR